MMSLWKVNPHVYFQEDALKLQEALEYDDEGATHFSSVDDEYKYGGVEDPKVH